MSNAATTIVNNGKVTRAARLEDSTEAADLLLAPLIPVAIAIMEMTSVMIKTPKPM